MLVPWKASNGLQTTNDQCYKREERIRICLAAEDMRDSAAMGFQAYCRPLETVTPFK